MKPIDHIIVVQGSKNGFNYGYVIHKKSKGNNVSYKEYFHDNPDRNICRIDGQIKSCEHCSFKVDSHFCRHAFYSVTDKEIKSLLSNNNYKRINNDVFIELK